MTSHDRAYIVNSCTLSVIQFTHSTLGFLSTDSQPRESAKEYRCYILCTSSYPISLSARGSVENVAVEDRKNRKNLKATEKIARYCSNSNEFVISSIYRRSLIDRQFCRKHSDFISPKSLREITVVFFIFHSILSLLVDVSVSSEDFH